MYVELRINVIILINEAVDFHMLLWDCYNIRPQKSGPELIFNEERKGLII